MTRHDARRQGGALSELDVRHVPRPRVCDMHNTAQSVVFAGKDGGNGGAGLGGERRVGKRGKME